MPISTVLGQSVPAGPPNLLVPAVPAAPSSSHAPDFGRNLPRLNKNPPKSRWKEYKFHSYSHISVFGLLKFPHSSPGWLMLSYITYIYLGCVSSVWDWMAHMGYCHRSHNGNPLKSGYLYKSSKKWWYMQSNWPWHAMALFWRCVNTYEMHWNTS